MKTLAMMTLAAVACLSFATPPAAAQNAKELKTKKGASVAMVNLVNATPDCKTGPIVLPTLREKPANGRVQMVMGASDVVASGNCPARKVPMIVLIYTPNADFTGADQVQIDIETGNRTTTLSYKIVVQIAGETL